MVFFCLLFVSGFFISACGSKNQDGPSTVISGEFIPATPVDPSGFISIIYLGSLKPKSDKFLSLDVNALNINGLVERVKFNIEFSGSVIQFENRIGGDYFFGTEEDVQYEITISPGSIRVSISRIDLSGRTGSGKLISIRFRLVGFGSSQLEFTGKEVLPPNGPDISLSISWVGGTIVAE